MADSPVFILGANAPIRSVRTYGAAATCWLLACVAAPTLVLGASPRAPAGDVVAVQLAIIVYAGTRLSHVIFTGEQRLFSAVFWIFTYVALGLAPLAQITLGHFPTPLQSPALLFRATVLVLVGCAAFEIGQLVARVKPPRQLTGMRGPQHFVGRRALVGLSVGAVLGSALYILAIGLPAFFDSRQALAQTFDANGLRSQGSQGGAAFLAAIGCVPTLIAFACWSVILVARRTSAGPVAFAWWAVLLVLNVIVNNPISNSRYWSLTVIASIVFILPTLSANRFRFVLVAGVLLAILVFPLADVFRLQDRSGPRSVEQASPVARLTVKDYDQLSMVVNGMWWVNFRGGHTDGRQILGTALFWLPRSAWESKPIDTGTEVATAMEFANNNLSSPLWIEAWVDFGTLGVLLVFVAWGFGARRIDDAFIASRPYFSASQITRAGLLLPLLAGYEFILLRGPLLQAAGRLAVMVLVVWAVTRPDLPFKSSAQARA